MVPVGAYLGLGAVLFGIGLFGFLAGAISSSC